MHILDKIVAHKKKEVSFRKETTLITTLESSAYFERTVNSLSNELRNSDLFGIIAEFKRKSPSQSNININADPSEITQAYEEAGVSGISLLTDEHFFGGSFNDFNAGRISNNRPMLRKDFIIDEYQIIEAKSIGADVILLIAEILTKEEVKRLAAFAHSLGLEVLMELHSEKQLTKVVECVDIVGVNNRNLDTFAVDFNTSLELFDKMPAEKIRISESGISNIDTLVTLKKAGFEGFLIGQCFMEKENPGLACKEMIDALQSRFSS